MEENLMNIKKLDPGLHILATPIGTANDITIRALDILRFADVLVAEDTRVLRKLMEIHGVNLYGRKILSYHDHNGEMQRPKIMHFSWIYILTGYFFSFFRKVVKKCRPYLAFFLEKNANLLGVFLKQYKIGLFLKSIS